MGSALTNNMLDKYLGFLSRLDNGSKKKLIIKLTESLEEKKNQTLASKICLGHGMIHDILMRLLKKLKIQELTSKIILICGECLRWCPVLFSLSNPLNYILRFYANFG